MMKRYALIAGGGQLPTAWAEVLSRTNIAYASVGFVGITDQRFISEYRPTLFRLGAIQKTLTYLRAQGVTHLMMVGYFQRPSLMSLRPDFKGFRWLMKLLAQGGDDQYLRRLITLLEAEGFHVCSPDSLVDAGLTLARGCYTRVQPSADHEKSIAKACAFLRAASTFDVGQAVVVNKQNILAVEGVEGTKGMIQRCGSYAPMKGSILVKAAKVGQEMRLDRPTIGTETIDQLVRAGFAGIAIQADACYVVDSQQTIENADKAGLFLTAIPSLC